MDSVRIDKFLWSVRLFKTRSIAAEECEKNRVLINDIEAKPSRHVKAGDKLTVKKLPIVHTYDIIKLIDKRQSAPLVKNYILETTPNEEFEKAEMARLTAFVKRDRGAGRPTKKERRELKHVFCLIMMLFMPFSADFSDTLVAQSLANDTRAYMETLRQTRQADFVVEQQLLAISTERLISQLEPFYSDTLALIRQKAYHLTFLSGTGSDLHTERTVAVERLFNGSNDPDGGIIRQTLRFLQQFSSEDFNDDVRKLMNEKISNTRMSHYKELVLLAGFVGAGEDEMRELLLDADLPQRHRWNISLALARMGDVAKTTYIVNTAKRLPISNDLVEYVLPELIYTRQKEAIDFCIELLFIDEKTCSSHNPYTSEKISCAWLVLPLLASVIADLPVTIDIAGDIAGDYQQALRDSRNWLIENRDYEISY